MNVERVQERLRSHLFLLFVFSLGVRGVGVSFVTLVVNDGSLLFTVPFIYLMNINMRDNMALYDAATFSAFNLKHSWL